MTDIKYNVEQIGRNTYYHTAEIDDGSGGGEIIVEARDRAQLDVRVAEWFGQKLSFETFNAAMMRPTMVYRFAAAKLNAAFHNGAAGATKTMDHAREEINEIVRVYARSLGMVHPEDDNVRILDDNGDLE